MWFNSYERVSLLIRTSNSPSVKNKTDQPIRERRVFLPKIRHYLGQSKLVRCTTSLDVTIWKGFLMVEGMMPKQRKCSKVSSQPGAQYSASEFYSPILQIIVARRVHEMDSPERTLGSLASWLVLSVFP